MVLIQRAFSFHWFFNHSSFGSRKLRMSDHRFYAYLLLLSKSFLLPGTHQHLQTMHLDSLTWVRVFSQTFYAVVDESHWFFFFFEFLLMCFNIYRILLTTFPMGLTGVHINKILVDHGTVPVFNLPRIWCVLFWEIYSGTIDT